MIPLVESSFRNAGRAAALALSILAFTACNASDRLDPGSQAFPSDPALATAAIPPGIVFASFNLQLTQLDSVHTGTILGGTPTGLLSSLSQVKSRRGRVLLRFYNEGAVRNADNTFNLEKWKAQVARFKYANVNFSSYVTDGTVIGHFIVDEPHFQSRWGNKVIPQATVEAMAKYSKQLWPNLVTVVSAPPTWLASAVPTLTYINLDAGWGTFYGKSGANPKTWIASQVAAAQKKGLGMIAGMNVLDGGNGSSGFHGNYPNAWAMSATELRTYGSALMDQTTTAGAYICGFTMWKYTSAYYGRADIKSAMAELSRKAKNHVRTSCKK
jgi:hypothetical protein